MSADRPADALHALGLAEWLRRRCSLEGDRLALGFGSSSWSYAALIAAVEQVAAVLAAGGLKPGERVAYLGLNHPTFLITLFATARTGAIFVPLNFRLTPTELAGIFDDAQPHTLIVAESHIPHISALRDRLGCQRYIKLGDAAPGWESLPALMDESLAIPPAHLPSPDETALIMFTSGTTGRPKGAMLSHRALWANNVNWSLTAEFSSTDIAVNSAPLFHVGGLCIVVLPVLMAGGHVILKSSFDTADLLTTIETAGVTVSFAVPAMLQALSEDPGFNAANLGSLRLMIVGGASTPASLLNRYALRGIQASQGFGMTETSTMVTFLPPRQANAKIGSCGIAAMLSEFRLVDFSGEPITEPGIKGEICARGMNVMQGYWNRPEATKEAFDKDGWFHSGDIGYLDAEGHLYVCDRLKDMVITGGENVYPAEVEGVLCDHPAIAEIAVIGAPDARWGERVVAVVALRAGFQLSLDELRSYARDRLAGYKIPLELRIVDALPRNPSGKILKGQLRAAIA